MFLKHLRYIKIFIDMKKIIKLTESDLERIIKRVIMEQTTDTPTEEELKQLEELKKHLEELKTNIEGLKDYKKEHHPTLLKRIANSVKGKIDRFKYKQALKKVEKQNKNLSIQHEKLVSDIEDLQNGNVLTQSESDNLLVTITGIIAILINYFAFIKRIDFTKQPK